MKNRMCRYVVVLASLLFLHVVQAAESFSDYVSACKSDLGFQDSDVPKSFDCTTADQFAPVSEGPRVNDHMGYARINDDVDLVFACRWLQRGQFDPAADQFGPEFTDPPFRLARSVEMLIHSRKKGSTCYFKSRDQTLTLPAIGSDNKIIPGQFITRQDSTPVIVVSPIVAATAAPNTPAANFWVSPAELDKNLPCVDCHIAGPYIATPRIASTLARYGLLNNGHDTFSFIDKVPTNLTGKYHAIGSTFSHFNADIAATNGSSCAGSCHNTADLSKNLVPFVLGAPHVDNVEDAILLTGIPQILDPAISSNTSVLAPGVPAGDPQMEPDNGFSEYRWINRSNPGTGGGVEIETFTSSKNIFPISQYLCGVPTHLEAHAVGSDAYFSAYDPAAFPNIPAFPDKLRTFNTREGLVCINADQPNGKQCNDYSVRYFCSDRSMSGTYNTDSPTTGDGDHEERTRHANVCGGLPAVGIEASTVVNGQTIGFAGPNDRLAQLTPTGLICKNSDQPNGATCSNYVVKYEECKQASEAYLAKIKNSWISPPTFGDRYLTTTAKDVNDAETRAQGNNYQWPSQDWVIEAIVGSSNVRLKDTWSGKYLTESLTYNSNGLAVVVVHNSDLTLMRQQWVIQDVPNSTTGEKYLRNVGTSRYLTVGNYTSDPYYAPIVSQSLSNQNWASQRWVIQ